MATAITDKLGYEVSYETYRQIELGVRDVETRVVEAIAAITGKPLPWLIGCDLEGRTIPGQLTLPSELPLERQLALAIEAA